MYLASDRMDALVLLKVLVALLVVLLELLDNVRADIRILLLDSLGHSQRILGGDHALTTLSEQVLHKRGQIASGNRHTLDS